MSCGCDNYEPFDLIVNCFAVGVTIPVTAEFTEQLLGKIEFAGYVIPFYVGVTDGEQIVIPNKFFNETAHHVLKLYRPGGALLNDTCYQITVTILSGPIDPVTEGVFESQFESQFE